jgi:hypothetical protein
MPNPGIPDFRMPAIPTIEWVFTCSHCGRELQRNQSSIPPALDTCPYCGVSFRNGIQPLGNQFFVNNEAPPAANNIPPPAAANPLRPALLLTVGGILVGVIVVFVVVVLVIDQSNKASRKRRKAKRNAAYVDDYF